jgi:hypothetical protein
MHSLKKAVNFMKGKIQSGWDSLNLNFYKIIVLWLFAITTFMLFVEAERLQEMRLMVLACTNLIIGLATLVRAINLDDDSDGTDIDDIG